MASEPCEVCDEDVPIGGGISGIWSSDPKGTGGMTLEFEDGSEFFLCFDCIEKLPDDPDGSDVETIR